MTEEVTSPEGAAETVETKEVKAPETKEIEAKAETEETEESAPSEKTEDTSEEPPKKKGGFQKRINQLTRTVRELERQLETVAKSTSQPAKTEPAEPKLEDFDDYGKYAKAVAQWEVKQAKTEFASAQQEEISRVLRIRQEDDFRSRLEAYSEKNEDFEEAVQEVAPLIRGAALEALMDSRHAPEIIHHLAKNPDDAERLSTLSPLAAAREIGKIEARLESKPQRKTTSAPPPAKTVTGNTNVSSKLENMDMKAFIKARRAGLNNR